MGGWYDYATGIYYSDPESAVVYQSTVDGAQLGDTRHARRGRLSLTVAVTPAGDSRVTLKRTIRVVG